MKIPGFCKNKYVIIAAAVLLIAAAAISVPALTGNGFFQGKNKGNAGAEDAAASTGAVMQTGRRDISIEPMVYDSTGVDPVSGFRITSVNELDRSFVETALSVQPEQDFSLTKVSEKELLLEFDQSLEPDSIYRFALMGEREKPAYSWAFQTRKEFRVVRSLPRNEGTGVPVNSGIEITFSHEGVERLEDFFEITPEVKGTFEYHKKVAVFVPQGLEHNTIYTVKVRKGLGLKGSTATTKEDYVFRFQTQPRDEKGERGFYFNFSQIMYNFTSAEVPALSVYGDNKLLNNELTVDVYRYKTAGQLIDDLEKYDELPRWAYRSGDEFRFDTSNLDRHLTFKTKVYNTESPWYQQFLVFPADMEEGHYLVSVSLGERQYNAHLQINDLSAYIMVDGNKTLVWANDSRTGKPMPGVSVEADGVAPVKTDEEGIAVANGIPQKDTESMNSIVRLTAEGRPVFVALMSNNMFYYYPDMYGGTGSNTAAKFWSYLYLDRGMYQPDDTIRLWGLVKPRNGNADVNEVTMELGKYTYSFYDNKMSVLKSSRSKLTPYGTFSGEIEYNNLNPGSYYVIVKAGEEILEQRFVEIARYVKPAYKIDVTSDRDECFLGEEINFDVTASFFEGSPVSGLNLKVNSYGYGGSIANYSDDRLVCDRDGHASLKYIPVLEKGISAADWRPVHINFVYSNAAAEEREIQAMRPVLVFPRDVMIEASGRIENKKMKLSFATNRIDLEKYRREKEADRYEDAYKGEPVDTGLKVKVFERYWEGREIGQYYDFINKVTRKRYNYYEVTKLVHEFECSTVKGVYEYEFPYEDYSHMRSYYMEITGTDSLGRPIATTSYIYNRNIYPAFLESAEIIKSYTIKEEEEKYKFRLNETASFKILENDKEFNIPQSGRVLYMTLKNGLVEYAVKSSNHFDMEFAGSLIPNAFLKAVYFDGSNVYNAGEYGLNYDYSERELEISMKTDKEQYRPGDTVNIDIKITDKEGRPCEAAVNLSVVDEAFFALREQWVDTVASVYSYVFGTGIISDYFSYSPMSSRYPHAECGEGGDAGLIRSDFKDNAFFGMVETDKTGQGKVSFRLPHNLTSWRVTCQGVTKDLKAGSKKININAKLPFFTTLIFNDVYLEGDSPGISLRSFGTEAGRIKNVRYQVVVESEGGYRKTFEKEQAANSYCNISMDSLAEGSYTVTVYADGGDFKDAIKKEFKVVKSILEAARTEYFEVSDGMDLASGLNISSENSLVELTFYNRDIARYFRILNSLYYSWGQRVDQVLSRKIAGGLLKEYFGADYVDDETINLKDYQPGDGGIALLTYDSSNPELSAKVASLAKDSFDITDLEMYFVNTIENKDATAEDVAASFWGLAALGKPVLLDIMGYLDEEGISMKEKLYLGIALAELGDYKGAEGVYNEIVREYAKKVTGYMYIDAGKDSDDIIEMTALSGMIALKVNSPDAEELFSYTIDKSSNDILTNLEKLVYLACKAPEGKKTGSFTLDIDGKKETIKLEGIKKHSMFLTYDMLRSMKISGTTGDVEVSAKFTGPIESIEEGGNSLARISRTYRAAGKESNEFGHSDIVEVVLDVQFSDAAPEGYYEITDVLPSGLRYVPPRYWEWNDWYWGRTDGQKISFGYFLGPKINRQNRIKYLARVVSPGVYTADNAVIKHAKSQYYSFAGRQVVRIRE